MSGSFCHFCNCCGRCFDCCWTSSAKYPETKQSWEGAARCASACAEDYARQIRETNADFKAVLLFYGSQPQFLQQAGKDGHYVFSETLLHEKINWKVTHGLDRAAMIERYKKQFPNAKFDADFQTALAYGAGVITEEIIKTAGTKFYLDDLGTPLGTTEIQDRVISFNMTVRSNRTTKKFLDTPEGQYSRRSGRGAREVTGQFRLELDRRDEFWAWATKSGLSGLGRGRPAAFGPPGRPVSFGPPGRPATGPMRAMP